MNDGNGNNTVQYLITSDSLVFDHSQNQPAIIPAPGTIGIANDRPLGLVQTFR